MKKLVNGELIDMTAEEIAERNADYEKSKEKENKLKKLLKFLAIKSY
jgi:hypothetical protein